MKKLITAFLALTMGLIFSTQAFAVDTPARLLPVDQGGNTYTLTYDSGSAGNSGKQFTILIVKKGTDIKNATPDSVLYIDQTSADSNGIIKFNNFQLRNNENADIYIGGETISAPINPYYIAFLKGLGSGDVDGDGNIDSADVTLLRRYIAARDQTTFGDENPNFVLDNAYVCGNTTITANDVTALRKIVASGK